MVSAIEIGSGPGLVPGAGGAPNIACCGELSSICCIVANGFNCAAWAN